MTLRQICELNQRAEATKGCDDGMSNSHPAGPGVPGLIGQLREDLATAHGDVLAPGFHAVAVHRFGSWVTGRPGTCWRP